MINRQPYPAQGRKKNDSRNRRDSGYLAFAAHRVSGLLLSLFLPAHFIVLGTALGGEENLSASLSFTEFPIVKALEIGLVFSLAMHLGLGLRLLHTEQTGRLDRQALYARLALCLGLTVAAAFLLSTSL